MIGYDYEDAMAYHELTSRDHRHDRKTGSEMQTIEQLQAKAQAAREEAEKLEAAIAARAAYGDKDPFKNGTIFKVEMRYRSSKATYTYAVIKIAGRYWLTGKVQQTRTFLGVTDDATELEGKRVGWTWDNFVAWLAQGDATVWRAKELEQVL
jgi:hypothetical protein